MNETLRTRHPTLADGELGAAHFKRTTIASPTVDIESRIVQGVVSCAVPDMDQEIVLPVFDQSYFPNSVKTVYFAHSYRDDPTVLPVGKNVNLAQHGDSMFATTYISRAGMGDDILTMMAEGIINGFSIGFVPIEQGPPTEMETKRYGAALNVVRKSKLIEYSITPMPCNPGALARVSDMVEQKHLRLTSVLYCFPQMVRLENGSDAPEETIMVIDGDAWLVA